MAEWEWGGGGGGSRRGASVETGFSLFYLLVERNEGFVVILDHILMVLRSGGSPQNAMTR